MKCGDRGFKNALGEPCGQVIGAKAKGCLWHIRTPAERSLLAARGPIASRLRRVLPASTPPPEFSSTAAIVAWAERTAQKVLTGELEPRVAGEARQLAALTVSARAAEVQEKLVDSLLKLEHGGAAFAFLARLQDGLEQGRGRPLPGRTLAIAGGEAS